MTSEIAPNAIVEVGAVRLGNRLPLALIAGPCAMESRAHALEMAAELKAIASKLKLGLIYKSSFDKANRTSGQSAGCRSRRCAAGVCRNPQLARRAGADRRA